MLTGADVRECFQAAKRAFDEGQVSAARVRFAQLVELSPAEPRAWMWRGLCARSPMEAALHYRRALELAPDEPHAEAALAESLATAAKELLERGVALVREGDRVSAREAFATVLRLQSTRNEARIWLALLAEEPQEAVAHLREAMHAPGDGRAASDGAKEALERTRTRLVRWLVAEGAKFAGAGDTARACSLFDDALALAPSAVDVLVWRASLETEPEIGRALVARALEIAPEHADALRWRKHFDEAEERVLEVLDADVTSSEAQAAAG